MARHSRILEFLEEVMDTAISVHETFEKQTPRPQDTIVAAVAPQKKTFGARMASYLERKHIDKDVTFIVGPAKEEIKALKVALKASSPVIEKLFEEQWDTGVAQEGSNGISLPDVDPEAFKIFIKILFLDDWTASEIEALKLPPEAIFNLIAITRLFKMSELEQIFVPLTKRFFDNFSSFSKTNEFLQLSSTNLETILSSDLITEDEVQVFEAASRWAETKCGNEKIPKNGENMRKVLGRALFQIRFPLMSSTEFTRVTCTTGLLTETEELRTYKCIGERKLKLTKSGNPAPPFISKSRNRGPKL